MTEQPSRRRRRRRRQSAPYAQRANRFSLTGWLLLGLILGLGGGLVYSWVLNPVVFTDASPARLTDESRAEYIELIGRSYVTTGDLALAQQRLATLEEEDVGQTVAVQLDEAIRSQKPDRTIRALAALGQALGVENQTVALFAPTPATAVPTPTSTPEPGILPTITSTPQPPTASPTALPTIASTLTPTNTPQPNFRLLDQQRICGQESPQIVVIVLDALLEQQPGVEVNVIWAEGQDRFFTGFKPEQGLGHSDFTMLPDVSYSVVLPDGSSEISGLRIEPCDDGTLAGWELTFQNLRLEIDN